MSRRPWWSPEPADALFFRGLVYGFGFLLLAILVAWIACEIRGGVL
jgi:hypothetical protein